MSNLQDSYVYTFISSQIPDHIKDDYELYELFLTAYYEWLCSEGQALYASGNITSFTDIDQAPEFFYSYLKNEILTEFPDNVLADKRLLLRYAKDFYERKGTEASYDFLFKVLYNDNISISYPSENILKPSDGKWVVEYILYTKAVKGNPYDLTSSYIYTQDGTQLCVDSVVMVRENKYDVYQLFLEPIELDVNIGDKFYNEDKSIIVEAYGVIKNIEVIDGGLGYNIGDIVNINDISGNGVNAVAMISNINKDNKISGFNIKNGGSNYRVGDQLVFTPVNGGSGASAYVSKINNKQLSKQCITTIETEQNVVLDPIQSVRIEDYIRLQDFEIGSIEEIKLVSGGYGYKSLPYITIKQEKLYDLPAGEGADIDAISNSLGQITEIKVINSGVGYTNSDYIEVDLKSLGNGQAKAKANIYGGIIKTDGYWRNNDGKLNSTMFLQDNTYYQNFSYVIKSAESINDYKPIVMSMVHPAGTQLYGEIYLNNEVNVGYDHNTGLDKEVQVHIQKEVIAGLEKAIKEFIIHIESSLNSSDIYGYEYFIYDFKDHYINKYEDVVLHDFKAIYQDLLIYDMQYVPNEQLWDEPINTLYGCSRPGIDSAHVAIVNSENAA